MSKIKLAITNIRNWFSETIERTFSSRKKTIKFVAIIIFTILFLTQIVTMLISNSFYNNASDDILQYYTIMVDFIDGLKSGTVSWFNLNNYFGASFFSDVYYIPIDVFTGITFLFSYLMPTEIAYSITELIKIFAGVMLFAYYLSLKGMKNRTIFWMSMIYFIAGGSVSFMAFPVFLSMTVYMPLALVVIHYFFHRKRWLVPLFAFASIFYDFYLGYTILAFTCFAFLIEYFKEPNFKFFKFIKETFIFVALLLLGVIMAAAIAYPSIIYILEETYRPTGSFDPWSISIFGHVITLNFGTFNSWVINIFGHELNLFNPNIYIRMIAKIFVEQKPIGFYGFENDYTKEHFSLYISIIGFVYMNYIFFMRGRISRVYKIIIPIGIILMIFPLFSYIFSGTLDDPYTRWINMLPIFQIMILAYVFDKYGFEKVKMKYMSIIIGILLVVLAAVIGYYFLQVRVDHLLSTGFFDQDSTLSTLQEMKNYYYARPILSWIFSDNFIDQLIISTQGLSSGDVIFADTILLCLAAAYLIILLVFGWLKKWTVVKWVFWVEFIVAFGYIYSGPIYFTNKIDTFQNAHDIEAYLDETIDDNTFYRVYVDINNLGVEDTNFNRMTGYATNTGIFHSWTDEETNDIGHLLYGSWEYQSKNNMNVFGYYINHFLGYKYVLTDATSDYALNQQFFTLYAANDHYKLYKMVDFSSFKVYQSFYTYDEFISYRNKNSEMATQKILLMTAVIDSERYVTDELNLQHAIMVNDFGKESISSYKTIDKSDVVTMAGVEDTSVRTFYEYSNSVLDIQYQSGAVYMRDNDLSLSDYGEVFMKFSDDSTKACQIQSGQSHQLKCEFFSTPEAIYVERTGTMITSPEFQVRQEAAFNRAAYLVYDLSDLDIQSDSGIINFSMSTGYKFGRTFVVDEYGDEYNCLDGFYSFNTKPEKLYVFKTSKMYGYSNLFYLSVSFSFDDLSDAKTLLNEDFVNNEFLSIEHGKINLSYVNTSQSTYDQIVVIPVVYSDDWKITSGVQYETMSTSGGFLGIVIPNGTTNIDITMKFVPKGLYLGFLVSLGGILVYTTIFLPPYIIKRKKGVDA